MGNEGRESVESNFHRKLAVLEIDARQRKLTREFCPGEAAEAGHVIRPKPACAAEGRQDAPFENARHGLRTSRLRPDRRKGIGRRPAFVGTAENFPIAKLASPAKAQAARGHATQRERDLGELAAFEHARIGKARGFGSRRRRSGLLAAGSLRGFSQRRGARCQRCLAEKSASRGSVVRVHRFNV